MDRGYVNIVPGTSGATITPYDIDTSVPDVPCTLELVQHSHTTHLSFNEPGQADVRITGLKKVLHENDVRITETRTVSVR